MERFILEEGMIYELVIPSLKLIETREVESVEGSDDFYEGGVETVISTRKVTQEELDSLV